MPSAMREPDIPLGLTGECLAAWAEPSDCEVCASSVARGSDIASSLYAPAEVAPHHLAPPATHTHHPLLIYKDAIYKYEDAITRGEKRRCCRFCEKPLKDMASFNLNYIEVYSRISALRRFSIFALVASRSLRAMHHRPFSKCQILKPIAIIMQNRMMKRQKQIISNKKDAVILNLLCIVPKRAEKP